MRRLIACFIVIATVLPAGIALAQAEDSQKVFMFVRDGSEDLELMLTEEVSVMRQMLEDAGYSVDIATANDKPMVSESMTLTPTVNLADVYADDYAGVILPCMAPEANMPVPAKVDTIVEQALALGKPIAASRASVVTLAQAGGVAGRQYTFAGSPNLTKRPEFAGGEFMGTGVIRDGNISTAGICPLAAQSPKNTDGTVELTQSFIESLAEAG